MCPGKAIGSPLKPGLSVDSRWPTLSHIKLCLNHIIFMAHKSTQTDQTIEKLSAIASYDNFHDLVLIILSAACICDGIGAHHNVCNHISGQCECKPHVAGMNCSSCEVRNE